MSDDVGLESKTKLTLIEFDDQQKAKIGAALQALAEATVPNPDGKLPGTRIPCDGNGFHVKTNDQNDVENSVVTNFKQESEYFEEFVSFDNASASLIGNKDEDMVEDEGPDTAKINFLTKEEPELQQIKIEFSAADETSTVVNSEDLSTIKSINTQYVGDEECGLLNDEQDDIDFMNTVEPVSQDEPDKELKLNIDYNKFIHYICPECGVDCVSYSNWKSHTEKQHTIDWLNNFSTIKNVKGATFYKCVDCKSTLRHGVRFKYLQEHRMKHLPHKHFLKCGSCDKKFQTLATIHKHIKSDHVKLARTAKKKPNPNMKYIKIFCPICQESQSNIKCWQQHLTEQHDYANKMKSKATPLGKGMYSCKLCKQKIRPYYIQIHMLKHEGHKSFQCSFCEKYETQLNGAIRHLNAKHFSEHQCSYCEARFMKKSEVLKHCRKFHKNKVAKCTSNVVRSCKTILCNEGTTEVEAVSSNSSSQVKLEHTNNLSTSITNENAQLQLVEIKPAAADESLLAFSENLSISNNQRCIEIPHVNDGKYEVSKNRDSTEKDVVDLKESDSQDELDDEQDDEQDSITDYKRLIHYICPECGINCGPYLKWKSHTEKQHMSNTIAWLNLSSIKTMDGVSYYECLDCNKKLSHKLSFKKLQQHRIKHLPHKRFMKCASCNKKFQSLSSIYPHIRKNHGKLALSSKKKLNPNMKYIKIFCPICQQAQSNIKFWRLHLTKEHDYTNKTKSQISQLDKCTYSCRLCQKKMRQNYITQHMLMHEPYKSFQCTLCDKYDTYRNVSIQHVNEKHFNTELECIYCEAKFTKDSLLWRHYHKFHKTEIAKCKICDKEFSNASGLFAHMSTTNHAAELNQSCENPSINEEVPVENDEILNTSHRLHSNLRTATDLSHNITRIKKEPELKQFEIEHSADGKAVSEYSEEFSNSKNFNQLLPETTYDSSPHIIFTKEEPQLQQIEINVSSSDITLPMYSEDLPRSNEKKSINMLNVSDEECGTSKNSCNNEEDDVSFMVNSIESDSEDEQDDDQDVEEDENINYNRFIHYICPDCGIDCGPYTKWKSHTEKEHMANTIAWLNFSSINNMEGESYYKCLDCNAKLSHKLSFRKLQEHRIKHLPHKYIMKCGLCNTKFRTFSSIYPHVRKNHSKLARSSKRKRNPNIKHIKIFCPICQEPQSSIKCWRQHLTKQHDYANKMKSQTTQLDKYTYSCRLCKKKMRQGYIKDHMLIHEPHKSFQCSLCEKIYTYLYVSMQHLNEKHFNTELDCIYCDAKFAKDSLLWKHYHKLHKKEIAKCKICGKEFPNASGLIAHMSRTNHSSELNQSCKQTNRLDYNQAQLEISNELSSSHQQIEVESFATDKTSSEYFPNIKQSESIDNVGNEECVALKNCCSNEKDDDSTEPDSQDEQNDEQNDKQNFSIDYNSFIQYICPECGVDCGPYSKWKLHTDEQHMANTITWLNFSSIKNMDGASYYECLDCNTKLSQKLRFRILQEHRIKHLPHKLFLKCGSCDKRFQTLTSIYPHIKRHHGNLARSSKKTSNPKMKYIKIFCPICQESQSNIKDWRQHLTEQHDYENKMKLQTDKLDKFTYLCRLCTKKMRQDYIKEHMLIHEPHKSFQCTLCEKRKTYLNVTIQHINHKHFSNELECIYCEARFAKDALLWKHYRKFHKKEIVKCEVCNKEFTNATKLFKHNQSCKNLSTNVDTAEVKAEISNTSDRLHINQDSKEQEQQIEMNAHSVEENFTKYNEDLSNSQHFNQQLFGTTHDSVTHMTLTKKEPQLQHIEIEATAADETLSAYSDELSNSNHFNQLLLGNTHDSSTNTTLTKEEPELRQVQINQFAADETLSTYNDELSISYEEKYINMHNASDEECGTSKKFCNNEKDGDFTIDSIKTDSQDDEQSDEQDFKIDYNSFIQYICPECGIDCGPYSQWKSHTEKQHMSNTIAWVNFSSIKNMDGESYYQCLDCNTKLSHKIRFKYLQEHHIKHLPHKFFMKCGSCDKKFQKPTTIHRHIKIYHAKLARSTLKKRNANMKYIKIFCPICQESQSNIKCWQKHLNEQHGYANKMKSQTTPLAKGMHSCKLCKQKIRPYCMQIHMLKHERHKSFQCTLCLKFENQLDGAIKHVQSKHFSEHQCSHCDARFKRKSLLTNHCRKFHKIEVVRCTVCDIEFLNASELLTHKNTTNHCAKVDSPCKKPSDDEDSAAVTAGSSNSSNQVKLESTNNLSTNIFKEAALIQPVSLELDSQDEQGDEQDEEQDSSIDYNRFIHYTCPDCGVDCGPYLKFKSHTEKQHMSNGIASFNFKSIKNANGESYYQCLDCNTTLNPRLRFRRLQEHRITHIPHKLYMKCSSCDKKFQSRTTMYKHIKENHAELARSVKKKCNPYLKHIRISCPICEQSESNIKCWRQHLQKQHDYPNKIKLQTIQIDKYTYSCRLCNQKMRQDYIKNHMLIHEPHKSFQCTFCEKNDIHLNTLLQHVQRAHFCSNQDILVKCKYCTAIYGKKSSLRRHHKEVHKDERFLIEVSAVNKPT